MKLPVQISFRNVEKVEWIENLILEKANGLERFFDHIISCRVVVEVPHRKHQQGNNYSVRIDISVPEKEIVVTRGQDIGKEHQEINATIREAFEAAKRQLEDYSRKRRGFVKTHMPTPHAKVIKLFPDQEEMAPLLWAGILRTKFE